MLSCIVLFDSCYSPIDDVCNSFGLSIKDGVSLVSKEREEYGGINSDCTSIYVYSITDSSIISRAKEKFYPYKNVDREANTIEEKYLINTSGYYQTLTSEQEAKSLYIDTIHNNLIFFNKLL
jgi:hypothetical protein